MNMVTKTRCDAVHETDQIMQKVRVQADLLPDGRKTALSFGS